jgi:hypothetical protein
MASHRHLLGTVRGVVLERADDLRERMLRVASECGFNVRGECFVQFEPVGATGVLVLAESHFSSHTFPEEALVKVDVYCCCATFDPLQCMGAIERAFGASRGGEWRVVTR